MTLELLKQIIFKQFKTEEFSHENVSEQGDAEVYIVNVQNTNFIIRIGNSTKPYSIPNNYYALKKLENTNVGPKPVAIGQIKEHSYSIETFLSGKHYPKLTTKHILLLIKKLSKIHSITNNKSGYLNSLNSNYKLFIENEMILGYVDKFKSRCPNAQKYLDFALQNIPNNDKISLLHGDLNENNILFTKDEAFLFDFEGCIYAKKEIDIANLNFRLEFSEKEIDLIVKQGSYNKEKILYYSICILIKKIANSPKEEIRSRVKKIERIYNMICSVSKLH